MNHTKKYTELIIYIYFSYLGKEGYWSEMLHCEVGLYILQCLLKDLQ